MSSSSWRNETEGRLRKAEVSLEAARALIERKPPCIDDAVNRASAAALQAARALVDARWPPHDEVSHDPTWRPGMAKPMPIGPYSKASWPVIVQQFEKASAEMALPFDAAEYLRTLVEDGHIADVGDMAAYEHEEANEAVLTADKLVRSVNQILPLAFALGYREIDGDGDFTDDEDENATTLEVMPLTAHQSGAGASPKVVSAAETDPHLPPLSAAELKAEPDQVEAGKLEAAGAVPPEAPIPLPGPGPAAVAVEVAAPVPVPAAAEPPKESAAAPAPLEPAQPAASTAERAAGSEAPGQQAPASPTVVAPAEPTVAAEAVLPVGPVT